MLLSPPRQDFPEREPCWIIWFGRFEAEDPNLPNLYSELIRKSLTFQALPSSMCFQCISCDIGFLPAKSTAEARCFFLYFRWTELFFFRFVLEKTYSLTENKYFGGKENTFVFLVKKVKIAKVLKISRKSCCFNNDSVSWKIFNCFKNCLAPIIIL